MTYEEQREQLVRELVARYNEEELANVLINELETFGVSVEQAYQTLKDR